MNGGSLTPDLQSRCILVQVDKNKFSTDPSFNPLEFVKKNRMNIIQELIGFIKCYQLNLTQVHPISNIRYRRWALLVNSILNANHYSHFLGNNQVLNQNFNEKLNAILNTILLTTDSNVEYSAMEIITNPNLKKFDPHYKLSVQSIGRSLKKVVDRDFEFPAFDENKYIVRTSRIKDDRSGGSNFKYRFSFKLSESQLSVVSVNNSSLNKDLQNLDDDDVFLELDDNITKYSHGFHNTQSQFKAPF